MSIIAVIRSGKARVALAALLMLSVGVSILVYLVATKQGPSGRKEEIPGRLVRVFKAERVSHRVAVSAFGTSRASKEWTAIAEVSGRAVEVNRRFEPGEMLPADMLLVGIDPTDYRLAVSRLEAELRASGEQLRELDQSELNLKEIVKLQQRQLKLASAEYERQQSVFKKNAGTRAMLENSEGDYISNLMAIQNSQNKLALIPAKRDLLKASRDAVQAQLDQANRNLRKCEIRLPFPARCADKAVEVDQYVAVGERLGRFLALDKAEVVAMLEVSKIHSLFPRGIPGLGTIDLADMNHGESFWKRFKVPVDVSWSFADQRRVWQGRLVRLASSLDQETRTIAAIIEVPHPYKNVQPGVRPPLLPDMFCEVTIHGTTLDNVVLVPRTCLRSGRVYILRSGKLHVAPVKVLVLEKDAAVIEEGIESGDLVVMADLFPANEGMPLRGKLEANPVKPRPRVDFPADLFEDDARNPAVSSEQPASAAKKPALEARP